MTYTLVAFHAHPDDEVLLTGGTIARIATEGHRVVLVAATLGDAGLASGTPGTKLAMRRRSELDAAARELGCARVETLGYRDSGLHNDASGALRFTDVPVDEAAARLATILRAENADVLTTYDPQGGYGHPDHIQVHQVGARAAALAGTPVVLEATVDRTALRPILAALRLAGRWLPSLPLGSPGTVFTDRRDLTHRVDVRPYLSQKRAALRAHVSQTEGGSGLRTVPLLGRLPRRVFAAVAGQEWFVERGRTPSRPLCDDVFASLR